MRIVQLLVLIAVASGPVTGCSDAAKLLNALSEQPPDTSSPIPTASPSPTPFTMEGEWNHVGVDAGTWTMYKTEEGSLSIAFKVDAGKNTAAHTRTMRATVTGGRAFRSLYYTKISVTDPDETYARDVYEATASADGATLVGRKTYESRIKTSIGGTMVFPPIVSEFTLYRKR